MGRIEHLYAGKLINEEAHIYGAKHPSEAGGHSGPKVESGGRSGISDFCQIFACFSSRARPGAAELAKGRAFQ